MRSERKESGGTPRFIARAARWMKLCIMTSQPRELTQTLCFSFTSSKSRISHPGPAGWLHLGLGRRLFPAFFCTNPQELCSASWSEMKFKPSGHIPNSGMWKEGKGGKWVIYVLKIFSRSCHTTPLLPSHCLEVSPTPHLPPEMPGI